MTDAWETEFGVIALSTKQLLSMAENDRNFLLAASLINNDIRFFWSLMARAPIGNSGTDLNAMQIVRWLWCSRKLASVIVEAEITLSKFCGTIDGLKTLAQTKQPILARAERKSDYFTVAREIRNSSASHYSSNALIKGLDGFSEEAQHRFFAHPQQGNSICEMSEQIFTLPLITSAGGTGTVEAFDNWCQSCSNSILKFCHHGIAQVLLSAFPDMGYEGRVLAVENEAAGKAHIWPLFLVIEPVTDGAP